MMMTMTQTNTLTCACSLYEQCGLGPHRTLFEQLHHASVSRSGHCLLVDLQDQVSLYQPRGSLGARLKHLHPSTAQPQSHTLPCLTGTVTSVSYCRNVRHFVYVA